jgi:hypothetical protein
MNEGGLDVVQWATMLLNDYSTYEIRWAWATWLAMWAFPFVVAAPTIGYLVLSRRRERWRSVNYKDNHGPQE